MSYATKTLAAGALLALSLTTNAAEANDCYQDNDGNFWGDCSEGFQVNNNGTSVTVIATSPPGTAETLLNIVTNWTGVWGSVAGTVNSVVQYLGGWETIGQQYFEMCQQHWSNCAGY
ncbi:MAG TPA: hypothetical protein VFQ53_33420 [Kofleriaceae bacterium]|nr:hypothetical protein [Kofleriaceae bacterium]